MATIGGVNTVTSGLVLALDASNIKSYVSGSATWRDLSGSNNHATLTAATSSLPSIEFTRNNNTRATINPLNLSSTNIITLDLWVNFKTLPAVSGYTGDFSRIICEMSDNFNNFSDSFLLIVEYELTGFRWGVYNKGNNGYNIKNLITPLPIANTWYNFTVVINNSVASSNPYTFYLNGINQTNIGNTANNGIGGYDNQNTSNFGNRIFRIGGRATTTISQDMLLSNFKIYNRALSSQEVLQNYNALKSRYNL
jgi:hypothetical protein